MAESKQCSEDRFSLTVLKNETKLVMEAFLQRVQNEGSTVGHIGRCYHDPRKFKAKTPDGQETITTKLPKHRKSLNKDSLERGDEEKTTSLKPLQSPEEGTGWDTMDEEEKKQSFKMAIKRLIKRQKKKGSDASDKKPNHSPDSPEMHGLEKNTTKPESKGNSLRRRKSNRQILAHTVDSSSKVETDTQESSKQRKSGRQKFLDVFRKVNKKSGREEEQMPPPVSPRPTTLALSSSTTGQGFYWEVAKQLDRLAQEYCAQPASKFNEAKTPEQVNNNVPLTSKERAIERIVSILQNQGDKFNEKIKDDSLLQHSMSYNSFSQLVEAFTANIEGRIMDPVISPELTKIALTMELTRRVVGISSHPVQQLMGYSIQYMDMFVPWLQEQGGWEKVLPLDDVSEHQID
ncbi:transcriptional regulator ATRX homolog [Narcine bancroftii]|uniref:transcriptional regulator ATRX homolog n=1 Tax=Narcine bancroftii TaxID=1343680 RepID=UPI003831AE3F